MIEAFNLLKEEEGTQFVVREAQWKQLVKLVAPDISNSHRELLLRISDDEQKGFIGEQWGTLCSWTGEEPGIRSLVPGFCYWDSCYVMDWEGLTSLSGLLRSWKAVLCACAVFCGQFFMAICHRAKFPMKKDSSSSQHRTKTTSLVSRFLQITWHIFC